MRSASSVAKRKILLGQQHGGPGFLQAPQPLEQRLHDERGETLGRLVQQQERRVAEQRARDGDHALLAARKR